jgi:hypothetical protein
VIKAKKLPTKYETFNKPKPKIDPFTILSHSIGSVFPK